MFGFQSHHSWVIENNLQVGVIEQKEFGKDTVEVAFLENLPVNNLGKDFFMLLVSMYIQGNLKGKKMFF